MSMPLTIESRLITMGKEKRVQEKENVFEVEFEGYHLFPLEEDIEVMRNEQSDQIGTAKVLEVTLGSNKTRCKYKLISLFSVN